ncbi:MAG: hypothetical protein MAG795_01237 [Candidatus Woesearchaeota archaeon]|nr:hypothetical protein [Candidatus Woesearchaeota archaeon]
MKSNTKGEYPCKYTHKKNWIQKLQSKQKMLMKWQKSLLFKKETLWV